MGWKVGCLRHSPFSVTFPRDAFRMGRGKFLDEKMRKISP